MRGFQGCSREKGGRERSGAVAVGVGFGGRERRVIGASWVGERGRMVRWDYCCVLIVTMWLHLIRVMAIGWATARDLIRLVVGQQDSKAYYAGFIGRKASLCASFSSNGISIAIISKRSQLPFNRKPGLYPACGLWMPFPTLIMPFHHDPLSPYLPTLKESTCLAGQLTRQEQANV